MPFFEFNLPVLPLFHAFCVVTYAVLIGYILIKNPKAPANQLCAIVLLCFLIWCLGKIICHYPGAPFDLVLFVQKFVIIGAWSFSTFILLFALALTGNKRMLQNKIVWFSLLAIPVLSIGLQWYDERLINYVPRSFGWGLSWQYGFFSFLLLGYIFVTTVAAGCICLIFSMTSQDKSRRTQSSITGVCILAGVVIGYGTNYVAPVFNWDIPDLAQNLGLIWLGGLVYAIGKYDLFEIDPVVATDEILSTMLDTLILVNASGRIVTVNSAGLTLLNTRIENIKGAHIETLFPEENDIPYDLESLFRIGDIKDKDSILRTTDGLKVSVSLSMSVLADKTGAPAGLLIIARDISERSQYKEELQSSYATLENRVRERTAELVDLNKKLTSEIAHRKESAALLKQSEAMFRLISEQSLLGIVVLKNKKIIYANSAWANITEFSVEEMLAWDSDAFFTRVHPDDRFSMLEMAERRQEVGINREENFDWRLIAKSGKEKWISMFSRLIPYEGDTAELATMLDITEKKNIFLSLQQSEAKYRLLVENANDAIFILQDEVIRFVNQKALEITGYSREELLHTSFVDLIHSEDRKSAETRYKKRIGGEDIPTTHNFRLINKAGEDLWIQSNAIEFKWHEQPAVLSFMRDITHTKKIENMLSHMQRQEALGTMASGIANDFNNILAPILGYAEMLDEDLRDDVEKHEKLTQIIDGAIRAKELINQILTLSTPQSAEKEEVDIHAVVEESINLSRALLPHGIEIKHDLDPHCGKVHAVPVQVHQMVMNFVANAHQAMLEKGGTLSLSLKKTEGYDFEGTKKQTYIHLQVSDTGVGMDGEVIKKIFNPYFSTKENSSGLGLSQAAAIITEMDGHIDVDSTPGEGSSFNIYLPMQTLFEQPLLTPRVDNLILTGKERIMLVDDEQPVLKMYEQILTKRGYQVSKFDNAAAAVADFNQAPESYDLIITDMSMPNMCGDAMAKKMQEKRNDIPIIICTGYSDTFSKKDALALGIKAYLRKPVSSKELLTSVRQALE